MRCELETYGQAYLASTGKPPAQTEEEVDLFGDDNDTTDLKATLAAKQKETAAKKKVVVAKSSVTFKAMPADGEVDITKLYESTIRKIEIDGLTWGVPYQVIDGPFGLKGLQFGCVVVDDMVKTDDIEEAIETIGLEGAMKEKYVAMRRDGSLDDYDEEWPGKLIGTVQVVSFQKI